MAMMRQLPPKVYAFFPPRIGGHHQHSLLNFLHNARTRYGDIYTLDLGLKQAVILNHPRHAHHLFRDHASNYSKGGTLMTPLRSISGGGVTTSTGQQWWEQRRALQPFFQRQHIATQVTTILTTIQEWLAVYLPQPLQATPINISELLALVTTQITTATLFHSALQPEQIISLSTALTVLNRQAVQGILMARWPVWLPLPGRQRYQEAIGQIDRIIDTLITTRQQEDRPADDLFTALHARCATVGSQAQAHQQLHDEVLALLVAGYETTATCLSWTCYLLARHPAVLAKVQQEIAQQLGPRPPAYTDLAALPYLTMTLYEALRLYPPSWRLSRIALDEDVIDGFRIAKGHSVITLVYLIHRHPQWWPDPDCFRPERFAGQAGALPTNRAWLPFGMGSRKCIGQDLALLEAKLILVTLLQRYQLTLYTARHPGIQLAMTLKPRRDLWLTLTTQPAFV